jgi:transcriptional regulator with XRE-family HTH domain
MNESIEEIRKELTENKDEKEYRHAYAEESLNLTIATQIKVLREQREWRQDDLAREAEMKQSMISRYENVNYSSWSINTLKKLAKALDVVLDVRFRSFRDLVIVTDAFNRESLEVPKFEDDPFFKAVTEEIFHRSEPQDVVAYNKEEVGNRVLRGASEPSPTVEVIHATQETAYVPGPAFQA